MIPSTSPPTNFSGGQQVEGHKGSPPCSIRTSSIIYLLHHSQNASILFYLLYLDIWTEGKKDGGFGKEEEERKILKEDLRQILRGPSVLVFFQMYSNFMFLFREK